MLTFGDAGQTRFQDKPRSALALVSYQGMEQRKPMGRPDFTTRQLAAIDHPATSAITDGSTDPQSLTPVEFVEGGSQRGVSFVRRFESPALLDFLAIE